MSMCILDINKTLKYDFQRHYNNLKYNNKAKLLFTDTDSLAYEMQTNDVYQDFWNGKNKFDNSNYSKDSKFYIDPRVAMCVSRSDVFLGNL